MKILTALMALVLSVSVFANCHQQSLNQQLDNAPVVQLNDGSQFVSYSCQSGCPIDGLVNFCAGVAQSSLDASVKLVNFTVNGAGRIIGRTLGAAQNLTQKSTCFVRNALGQMRAVSCSLIGSGLGLAHNSVNLARTITRNTVGASLQGLRRLRQAIFGGGLFNRFSQGQVCGCSVGAAPAQQQIDSAPVVLAPAAAF